LLVRGRQHHAAHLLVIARALQGADEAFHQLRRKGVARVRIVQRDRRNAVADLVEHLLAGHHAASYPQPRAAGSEQSYCLLFPVRPLASQTPAAPLLARPADAPRHKETAPTWPPPPRAL